MRSSLVALFAAAALQASSACTPQPLASALPPHEALAYWSSRADDLPGSWENMDWPRLTTLAVFNPWPPPSGLVCAAHSHDVRVVRADSTQWMHTANRSNTTYREEWVRNHVSQMVAFGTDGVNVDLEAYHGGLPGSKTPTPNAAAPLLTSLLVDLGAALRRENPRAQLSLASQVWPTSYPAYFYGGYNCAPPGFRPTPEPHSRRQHCSRPPHSKSGWRRLLQTQRSRPQSTSSWSWGVRASPRCISAGQTMKLACSGLSAA
jgi:hypothetical protein